MRAWPKGCNSWRDINTPDGARYHVMAEGFVNGRQSYEKQLKSKTARRMHPLADFVKRWHDAC
jgi:hypothetical protein